MYAVHSPTFHFAPAEPADRGRRHGLTLVELPAVSGRKRAAFTLVELLVVIGIISVLIAILVPVLSKARRKALEVACLSNLRQVGMALLAYAHEYGGSFPAPAASFYGPYYEEDWVHWQPDRDVRESRLWPYLGGSEQVPFLYAAAMHDEPNIVAEKALRRPIDGNERFLRGEGRSAAPLSPKLAELAGGAAAVRDDPGLQRFARAA